MTSMMQSTTNPVRSAKPRMASDIIALNRRYLNTVRQRALCGATTVNRWQGCVVRVFLRHESDHVFAIAADHLIGMADYVAIDEAIFHVDQAGRQQACAGEGSLPNGRNVHAFVTGRLAWAAMHSCWAVPEDWEQIAYNPHHMTTFQVQTTSTPIHRAETVVFTPDPVRVRCRVPAPERAEASE